MSPTKNLTLTKEILKREGLVILPIKEYEKIRNKIERLKREKDLSRKESEVLKIIAEGEKEYREGNLKSIKSLADLD